MRSYDLVVIGSGPGGYVAALYASRHKMSVCVVEEALLGGTCLNLGCIPTKSFLNSASIISTLKSAPSHGIDIDGFRVDFGRMASRKDEVVSRLRAGIETLFRANKIDLVKGRGCLRPNNIVHVDGFGEIYGADIIIATGSRPAVLPNLPVDESEIVTSSGILGIRSLPESIIIVGGGAIGSEFASLFCALGSKVTLLELLDRILPTQSREASKKMESIFKKSGVEVRTSSKVEKVVKCGALLKAYLASGDEIEASKILVSVGRVANTESLGLAEAGVKIKDGRIRVDEHLRTDAKRIYAIGDCINGPQLAHKASYDAVLACDNIIGSCRKADYSNVPNCIWTEPEIASVGLSEEDAKSLHPDAKVAKFPYLASGKAYIEGKVEGFVKICGNKAGDILGVEIMGKGACDLISEAAVARAAGMKIEEWGRVVHGHPTISEILQEAARAFCGTPIHSI